VAVRTVAAARAQSAGGELIELVLRPADAYAALPARAGGLSASLAVAFSAIGRPPLSQSLQVTFLRKVHASHARRHARSSRGRRRSRR